MKKLSKGIKELFELVSTASNDWVELAVAAELSPAELTEAAEWEKNPMGRLMLRRLLANYRKQIARFVDDVILDGRPWIDKQQQIEVYWNSPVTSRNDLCYSVFKKRQGLD